MRIALVVPAFPQLSETFVVGKFLGLLARGLDVHVVCARSDAAERPHFPALADPAIARRIHVAGPTNSPWRAAAQAPREALRVAADGRARAAARSYLHDRTAAVGTRVKRAYLDAALLRLRPDVVHFEFGSLAPGRLHVRRLLGASVVVSFRGYDIDYVGLDDPSFYDDVWREADAIHVLGAALWRRAVARGCPTDKPHALIPPAIDVTAFASSAPRVLADGEPLHIVSVGRLTWVKGYEYALQAVRLLRQRGVACRYTVVGGGDHLEAIAFARRQLGVDDAVELTGAVPPSRVREILASADVFLHAAVAEGFCNAVIEAQAMQLPVVCSDAGGLPENVADGETGFVVPRRDPAALTDRLVTLAGDPSLRAAMGRAGRARVLDQFRLADQLVAFEALYRRVIQHAGAARSPVVTASSPSCAPSI